MFLCVQKAQKATFFNLDVFMRTKLAKSTRRKALFLDVLCAQKMLSFLLVYVHFVLFVLFFRLDVLRAFKTVFAFICLCAFYDFYAK